VQAHEQSDGIGLLAPKHALEHIFNRLLDGRGLLGVALRLQGRKKVVVWRVLDVAGRGRRDWKREREREEN
jgi:hypothetical protein